MKHNNQPKFFQYAAPPCRVMFIIPRQVVCHSGNITSSSAGLFSGATTARAWDFNGCKVKNGTKCQNITITSENLVNALIGRGKTPTSVTNPPTFVDSF